MPNTDTLTVGFRRVTKPNDETWWVGLVRCNGQVVVECGHEHYTRDFSNGANGRSARSCADQIIDGARRPVTAERISGDKRTAWTRVGAGGFTQPAGWRETARQDCADNADAYMAVVATVREALATAVPPAAPEPVPAPVPVQEIGEMPDWMTE